MTFDTIKESLNALAMVQDDTRMNDQTTLAQARSILYGDMTQEVIDAMLADESARLESVVQEIIDFCALDESATLRDVLKELRAFRTKQKARPRGGPQLVRMSGRSQVGVLPRNASHAPSATAMQPPAPHAASAAFRP